MIAQLDRDLKSAMLAGDRRRITTLRMLKSALTNMRIAKKADLDEATINTTLQKEAKQRQEAAESFKKAGRTEQAAEEQAEYEIIMSYLPKPLTDEEITTLITQAIKATGATNVGDMGKVMGWLQPQVSGKTDGSRLAQLVRQSLSS